MKYLVLFNCVLDFESVARKSRCFDSASAAKAYVYYRHGEDWDLDLDEFKNDEEWEEARLFEIQKDGILKLLSVYDTTDLNDFGECRGWRNVQPSEVAACV